MYNYKGDSDKIICDMNEKTITDINVILNHWSLTIQVAVLCVFVVIFFALKLSSPRRVIHTWFMAWSFDVIALTMVIFVLNGTGRFSDFSLQLFYSLYALAKIWFAIMLFEGLYQLINQRKLLTPKQYKIIATFSLLALIALINTTIEHLLIQITVYLLVGLRFFTGAVLQIRQNWQSNMAIILAVFILEGLVFLHHGLVLIPVAQGSLLPDYMTHISFFDALVEMVLGISCLFAISNVVIKEMTVRNAILAKSQSTLRKLVNVDPLTGLWHRRYFDTFLKQYKTGATIVYFKIDHLSAINDEWGWSVGDLCIKEMSKVLKTLFGDEDGLFRIKGNSFLIITPGLDEAMVTKKVQHFKNTVAANPMCAPVVSISSTITSYQEPSELKNSLVDEQF